MKVDGNRRRSACAVLLMAAVCGQTVGSASESVENHGLQKGRQIFRQYCAGCHGPEGQGDGYRLLGPSPADLTSRLTQGKSDEDLLQSIHAGRPNMPAWNVKLTETDRQNVLAYIRSLVE
jgi:mono/diheme cytochrome c family protein